MIVPINLHFVKFLLNEHGMVWYGIPRTSTIFSLGGRGQGRKWLWSRD